MKTKTYLISGGIAFILATFFLGRWTAPNTNDPHAGHNHDTATNAESQIWTCSMHPQIQNAESGNCPICGMKLIPVGQGAGSEDGPRSFSMSESAIALAEIETSPGREAISPGGDSPGGKTGLRRDEREISHRPFPGPHRRAICQFHRHCGQSRGSLGSRLQPRTADCPKRIAFGLSLRSKWIDDFGCQREIASLGFASRTNRIHHSKRQSK